jgi:hypothetical protein
VPSVSSLRHEARQISEAAGDTAIAKLAGIIEQLCIVCDDLEKKTKEALAEAKRAKREARK